MINDINRERSQLIELSIIRTYGVIMKCKTKTKQKNENENTL